MAESISPVAIGVISDPPTIVISYDCMSALGERRKRRKRKMPLRDFTDKSNVKRYAFNLRQRHSKYLANVIDVTLEKMLRIIQEIQKGNSVEAALKIVNKEYSIDEHEDLNKLSPAELAQRKAVMDEMFHKNMVKPGDPDFVYDREVKFETKIEKADGNDWDEESEKLREKEKDDALVLANIEENNGTKKLLQPLNEACDDSIPANINLKSESLITTNVNDDKEAETPEANDDKDEDDLYNVYAFPKIFNNSSEMKMNLTPVKDGSLSKIGVAATQKSDDDSSSMNNIEEALVKIESGGLEEEDEDFWQ